MTAEKISQERDLLDQLLDEYLRRLSASLSKPHTLEDIQAEIATLDDILNAYKRRDQLLEKLLDTSTPEEKRRQIRETLKAQRAVFTENIAELKLKHDRSRQVLEKSILLIAKAQQQIDNEAHRQAG